jgi:murein DD-endopeptidase MepM/ murein hydrolase activator NlpD
MRYFLVVVVLCIIVIMTYGPRKEVSHAHGSLVVLTVEPLTEKQIRERNAGYEEATRLSKARKLRLGTHTSRLAFTQSHTHLSQEFVRPVSGACTQGPHGKNKSGVDLRASVGTPVHAYASGVVSEVKRHRTSGKYIVIQHRDGTSTFYGHLHRQSVRLGDVVESGDVIGQSGNTGRTTGPHLHFAVRGGSNPFCKPV